MVARQVTVEQMRVHPVGAGTPMDPAQVHHVAGQPHPSVVVKVARVVEHADRGVDHWNPSACLPHVGGQLTGIGIVGQRPEMTGVEDRIPARLPHMTKELAPPEFEHEEVMRFEPVSRDDTCCDLRQVDETVGDVGRQPSDGAVQRVAGARVVARMQGRDARTSLGRRG